ncbi:MAG: hypothetical protein IJ752_09345 [Alphaproteobacteria bacterium]|nr:hypothetical protein [Alphaproteobacteria bacterium]
MSKPLLKRKFQSRFLYSRCQIFESRSVYKYKPCDNSATKQSLTLEDTFTFFNSAASGDTDRVSDSDTMQVVLLNGAGYTVDSGKRLPRWGSEVSVQSEIRAGQKTPVSVEYAGTLKKDYQSHAGMLKQRSDF